MRWSIIRLIWCRELRDQLRDRRTLFMIVVLPLLLYPAAGLGLMRFALGFLSQESTVRVVGHEHLPPWSPRFHPAVRGATWLAALPTGADGPLAGVERLSCAASLDAAAQLDYPPLVDRSGPKPRFAASFFDTPASRNAVALDLADTMPATEGGDYFDHVDRSDLQTRKVDLILVVPPDFAARLAAGERPPLHLIVREGDARSRLVYNRVSAVLAKWKARLKEARLLRRGLPADFDEPFELRDPEQAKTDTKKTSDELSKILAQIFPFVLVMWSLAGALYPAVDLCAGEKERGTMETLLISPVSREEIVWGKFLTIWVFSAATALLNLLSMGLTTWFLADHGQLVAFRLSFLVWGAALLLPLSAFFSALCLAVGVYARSSKEGQYYLMPLFLLTMPLVFLTFAPGVELNHFYSMVPVTGVALLLQALMKGGTAAATHGMYLLPVLAPMVIYSWLALRWAIEQFQREEVLFREAERLEVGLWLKRLFREKEALPSTGQALFCFLAVLVLHGVTMSAFARRPAWTQLAVGYLAMLAVPLFLALLLTRRPRHSLGLKLPRAWAWPVAVLLAALLFLPGAELTYYFLRQVPDVRDSLKASQPQLRDGVEALAPSGPAPAVLLGHILTLVLLPPVLEELTFRGLILTGLRRRFRPWTAVGISSFLFALFQMNVFQCVPHFALGVVLGVLAWRSGSVLPAVLFHLVYNGLVYLMLTASVRWPEAFRLLVDADDRLTPAAVAAGVASALLAAAVLAVMVLRGRWRASGPVSRPPAVARARAPEPPASRPIPSGDVNPVRSGGWCP